MCLFTHSASIDALKDVQLLTELKSYAMPWLINRPIVLIFSSAVPSFICKHDLFDVELLHSPDKNIKSHSYKLR